MQLFDYVCCSAIYQMATIRDAFRHIEDNTCVRFKEVRTDEVVNTSHILVSNPTSGYVYASFACMFLCLSLWNNRAFKQQRIASLFAVRGGFHIFAALSSKVLVKWGAGVLYDSVASPAASGPLTTFHKRSEPIGTKDAFAVSHLHSTCKLCYTKLGPWQRSGRECGERNPPEAETF